MIEKIEILLHGESSDLGRHPGEQAAWLLCVVAYHHELVVQLGEYGLNPLPEALVLPARRFPVLLVHPVWHLKGYARRLKQIQLHGRAQVTLVRKHRAVMILPLDVLEVVQVMDIGGGQVIGVYDARDAAQRMELVSVVAHVLGGAVAPGRRMLNVAPAHLAPVGADVPAHPDGLGVYAEHILAAVDGLGYGLADALPETHRLLPALIVLPAGNQVGDFTRVFLVQKVEQVVLAVYAHALRRNGKRNHLHVGEGRHDAAAGDISTLVHMIFSKMLAYLKNFSELCNEVVHIYDNSA